MDALTSETCWALNNEIIKQVTSSWSLFIQLYRAQPHSFAWFCGHRNFVTLLTRSHKSSLSWLRWIQFTSSNSSLKRTIITLPSHLILVLRNGSFPSKSTYFVKYKVSHSIMYIYIYIYIQIVIFKTKISINFSFPNACLV